MLIAYISIFQYILRYSIKNTHGWIEEQSPKSPSNSENADSAA